MQIRFTCTSSQWSGGEDIPVECRTHQYVTEALLSLLLQLRQASRKLSFCSSIYTLRQCCEKRRRSGGTSSTREREGGGRSEHTTLCTQNQTLHPITKSTGSDEITCPPHCTARLIRGKICARGGRKRGVPGKSSSKRCNDKLEQPIASDSENGYLY